MDVRGVPLLALLLLGCGDELFSPRVLSRWCDDAACGLPSGLTLHGAGEVWLYDRPSARRRDGRWEKQNPCGGYGVPVELAFERDVVWARCEQGLREHLVRSAAGTASRIEVPSVPRLIALEDDVLFSWADDGFFAWDGSGFTLVAPPQQQRLGLYAWGFSRSNFYFEGKRWDGSSWQMVDPRSNLSHTRGYPLDGKFCAGGRFIVDGLKVTDLMLQEGFLEATARQGGQLFAAWNCERLWVLQTNQEEAVVSRLEAGRLVRVGTLGPALYHADARRLRIDPAATAIAKDRLLVKGLDDFYEVHLP